MAVIITHNKYIQCDITVMVIIISFTYSIQVELFLKYKKIYLVEI